MDELSSRLALGYRTRVSSATPAAARWLDDEMRLVNMEWVWDCAAEGKG